MTDGIIYSEGSENVKTGWDNFQEGKRCVKCRCRCVKAGVGNLAVANIARVSVCWATLLVLSLSLCYIPEKNNHI